jgi:hypothetical protein
MPESIVDLPFMATIGNPDLTAAAPFAGGGQSLHGLLSSGWIQVGGGITIHTLDQNATYDILNLSQVGKDLGAGGQGLVVVVRDCFLGPAVPKWLATYTDQPSGIMAFCEREGISLSHAKTTIDLADKSFPFQKTICVQTMEDPEDGEKWLELELMVAATVKQARDAYRRFIRQWMSSMKWKDHAKIKMTYRIK